MVEAHVSTAGATSVDELRAKIEYFSILVHSVTPKIGRNV
jgi:hypothetical protein